jgi:hypothetical protein
MIYLREVVPTLGANRVLFLERNLKLHLNHPLSILDIGSAIAADLLITTVVNTARTDVRLLTLSHEVAVVGVVNRIAQFQDKVLAVELLGPPEMVFVGPVFEQLLMLFAGQPRHPP